MVYPGDVVVREKGGILKSFSIKLQWIPVFWESGLIVSWAGVTSARGDPQGGELQQENPRCPGGLGRSAGMWGVKKSGLFYPKIEIMGKNKHRNGKLGAAGRGCSAEMGELPARAWAAPEPGGAGVHPRIPSRICSGPGSSKRILIPTRAHPSL